MVISAIEIEELLRQLPARTTTRMHPDTWEKIQEEPLENFPEGWTMLGVLELDSEIPRGEVRYVTTRRYAPPDGEWVGTRIHPLRIFEAFADALAAKLPHERLATVLICEHGVLHAALVLHESVSLEDARERFASEGSDTDSVEIRTTSYVREHLAPCEDCGMV